MGELTFDSFFAFHSEDVYASVRLSLLERARDKEVPVRVQAILALSSFHGQDAEDEDEIEVLGELMDITATDPSAFVFLSLSLTPPLSLD